MKLNLKELYDACVTERLSYLNEAQVLAELTIPSLEPIPAGTSQYSNRSTTNSKKALKRPYSDAGARALKGWSSTLVSTLAPANVQWHKLITDPDLDISEQDQKLVDEVFKSEEKRMARFLQKFNFNAVSNSIVRRLGVEGNIVIKVDAKRGIMVYPLRSIGVKRRNGEVVSIVLQEMVKGKDAQGNVKDICQYIYIDKDNKQVYVQREDEDNARLTDEYASQYFVVTTDIPTIDNYARSFYSDHYGLLKTINVEAEQLLEAMANAAWTPYFYSGSTNIPLERLTQLKSRDIFRLPAGDNPPSPLTTNAKISDWEFIAAKYQEDVQSLLNLSAVGLMNRAAQIQTATEVNALMAELNGLVGATASVLADTLYKNVMIALLDILGIRDSIRNSIMESEGVIVDDSILEQLVQPIVITGTPAFAREQDSERMLSGISNLAKVFGPEVLQYIDAPSVIKEYLDGLRINTEGIVRKQEDVQQQLTPEQIQQIQLQQQQGG